MDEAIMGLLDNLMPGEWDNQGGLLNDRLNSPLLQIGLGILANNDSKNLGSVLGRGALAGLGNIQQQRKFAQDSKYQNIRQKQIEAEMLKYEREQQQAQAKQEAMPRLMQGKGAYTADGVFDQARYNQDVTASGFGDDLIKKQLMPADPELLIAPNGMAINKNDVSNIGKDFAKAEDSSTNPNKPFMIVDGKIVANQAYQNYEMSKAAAGSSKTNVSVNTGQKGFDNTLKLRGDFRSEPIYKAHQDVQSAHAQITASLKKASPAGDLAGATKLMKILDPGSVVRESELGMAMAASGKLDRLENYGSMLMSGNKLTPKQRVDFQGLANELSNESAKLYNVKRDEYKGIANRNELNELDVLGNAETIKPVINGAPMPAKPNALNLKKGTVYQTPKGALRWNGKAFED